MRVSTLLDDSDPEPFDRADPGAAPRVHIANPNRYREGLTSAVRPWLERLVGAVAGDRAGTLAVRFVSDREMQRLNRQFRGKDRTTDVLSFPGGPSPEGPQLGDLAVSVPAARRQAAERGHSTRQEIETLLIHGLLHCLGHDHETDQGEMAALEARLRQEWGSTP